MNTASITGPRYFLLFVDDFSRKMWEYFLKLKSDVFEEFQNFKASAESESGCQITSLGSDNGGEFCSKEFNNFCAKHGMKRQYTTPYTPKQNGVVEW
jgi:transposase InsO family protein